GPLRPPGGAEPGAAGAAGLRRRADRGDAAAAAPCGRRAAGPRTSSRSTCRRRCAGCSSGPSSRSRTGARATRPWSATSCAPPRAPPPRSPPPPPPPVGVSPPREVPRPAPPAAKVPPRPLASEPLNLLKVAGGFLCIPLILGGLGGVLGTFKGTHDLGTGAGA